jgi:hypothetical protein
MNSQRAPLPSRHALYRQNLRLARAKWGIDLSREASLALRAYSEQLKMSIERGDLMLIDRRWYVTHSGLLRLASRRHCHGIDVAGVPEFCDPSSSRWAFKATVYTSSRCKGFVGHGDADPSNVSSQVRGAEMRVAETRAVNRALRKAYAVGVCSVEELSSFSGPLPPPAQSKKPDGEAEPVNGNRYHPLRDRLCLLMRQHQLDPARVKAYAADYCDVPELRQASREQVATFVKHLAEYAQSDHEGLLCQLTSYAPKPVTPVAVTTPNDCSQPEEEKALGAA